MSRIAKTLEIFEAARRPLFMVLDGIPGKDLAWPAPQAEWGHATHVSGDRVLDRSSAWRGIPAKPSPGHFGLPRADEADGNRRIER